MKRQKFPLQKENIQKLRSGLTICINNLSKNDRFREEKERNYNELINSLDAVENPLKIDVENLSISLFKNSLLFYQRASKKRRSCSYCRFTP